MCAPLTDAEAGNKGEESAVLEEPSQPTAPARWPDEIYDGAAVEVGRAFYRLLNSQARWVHRRVETITLLSREVARRSVSVDFTVPEMFWDPLKAPGGEQWFVPLAMLPKRPVWTFDLRAEGGEAIPVLGKAANSPLAEQTLFAAALRALERGQVEELPEPLRDAMKAAAVEDREEAQSLLGQIAEGADEVGGPDAKRVVEDPRSALLLEEFAKGYLLVGLVDNIKRRRVIKYAYDHPLLPGTALADPVLRLGWKPLVVETSVPSAGRTASYHAEIVIPEELSFDGSLIYDKPADKAYALGGRGDRALLHAPEVPPGAKPVLIFAVRPQRTGFPMVACLTAWISTLLLVLGAWPGRLDVDHADASIGLLVAGLALFAGAVASSGEHPLVQSQFALPRVVLVLVALMSLGAAATLVFNLPACTIDFAWKAAAFVNAILASILTVTFYRAASAD